MSVSSDLARIGAVMPMSARSDLDERTRFDTQDHADEAYRIFKPTPVTLIAIMPVAAPSVLAFADHERTERASAMALAWSLVGTARHLLYKF
jgi:hypothetical protein